MRRTLSRIFDIAGVKKVALPTAKSASALASRPSAVSGDDSQATLEKFYHHVFRSDTTLLRLVDELHLREQARTGR